MVALAFAGAVAMAPVLAGCGAGEEPQTAAPTQLTEGVNASVPKTDPARAQVDIRNMFLLGPEPEKALAAGSSVPLYATLINQVPGRADRLVSVSAPEFGQAKIAADGVALPAAKERGMGSAVSLLGTAQAPQATPSGKPAGAKPGKPGAKPSTATPTTPTTGTPSTPASGSPSAPASGAPSAPASGTPSSPAGESPTTPPTGETAPATGAKGPLVILPQSNKQLVGGETIQVTLQFEKAGSITLAVPVIPRQNEFSTYVPVSQGVPFTPVPTAPTGSGGPSGVPSTPATPDTEPTGSAHPTKSGEPHTTETPAA
ncbi:hypothetical protein DZF91_06115 [Actinomadura logoneensis]|uniref:Copper chaperone PCu(A)C n=1 Tax=Actinomadura logoneensis TaxID=2293572 RepID=A0A372JR91_9ACTN|nr:hypothetical protein DZF91_06115 [Actinomadura logoneensis]